MTDAFEAIADRATHRLRADPELQLDVRRELLSHLRAAEAEHRAADPAAPDPAAAAAASLGEPDALADQLWQTHSARIRRRVWARRAAGMLLPGLLVAALVLAWSLLRSAAPALVLVGATRGLHQSSIAQQWLAYQTMWIAEAPLRALPADRRIFVPQKTGGAFGVTPQALLAQARAVLEAGPGDRALAFRAAQLAMHASGEATMRWNPSSSPAIIHDARAFVDRVEAADPDNAFFPMMRACSLLTAVVSDRGVNRKFTFPYVIWDVTGDLSQRPCIIRTLKDAAKLAELRRELREALSRPALNDYHVEYARRCMAAAPEATDLASLTLRADLQASLARDGTVASIAWALTNDLISYAVTEAAAGHADEALAWSADVNALAARVFAARPEDVYLSHPPHGGLIDNYVESVCGHTAVVLRLAGRTAEADKLLDWKIDRERALRLEPYEGQPLTPPREPSVIGQTVSGSLPAANMAFRPARTAELTLADRLAMIVLLLVLVTYALGVELLRPWATGRSVVLMPTRGEAVHLFLAAMTAAAVVIACRAVAVAYGGGLESFVWYFNSTHRNLGDTLILARGYAVGGGMALTLLFVVATACVRRRLAVLGVRVSAWRAFGTGGAVGGAVLLGWTLTLATAGMLAAVLPVAVPRGMLVWPQAAALLVLLAVLLWRAVRRRRAGGNTLSGPASLTRSVAARLLGVGLVAVLLATAASRWVERDAVARIVWPAAPGVNAADAWRTQVADEAGQLAAAR